MLRHGSTFATFLLALAGSGCVHIVTEQDLLPGAREAPPHESRPADLEVEAADGSTLRGYAFTGAHRPFVLLYFGGNDELITADSALGAMAERYGLDIYAVNYRGFPPSSGAASFDAIHDDGVRVYDAVAARPDVRGRPIVVYGYSIGTVAALTVATSRPVAGVVLQGAPSTAAEVVPKMRRALPWYTRMWTRLRPTPEVADWKPQPIDLAPKLVAPLLSIHGTKDRVVAPEFGREVFEAAASAKKTWCPIQGGEHMGLWVAKGEEAGACLERFLGELGK